jgi:hypothetical protein
MPLFRPVDWFDNNVLFQATKDHSAGQEFDVTKRGNRDSNILGLCCYCCWFCLSSGFSFGTDRSNASPGLQSCQQKGMITQKWKCSRILTKFGFKSCFQVVAKDFGNKASDF